MKFKATSDLSVLEKNVKETRQHEEVVQQEYDALHEGYKRLEVQMLMLRDVVAENYTCIEKPLEEELSLDVNRNRLRATMRQERMESLEQKKLELELRRQRELLCLKKKQEDKLSSLIEAGKRERKIAAVRLRQTRARDQSAGRSELEEQQREQERREWAMKDLMRSTQRIRREILGNASRRKKRQEEHEKKERELITAGENPYEILKRRKEQAKAEDQRRKKLDEIAAREEEIVKRIAKEVRISERESRKSKEQKQKRRLYEEMVGPHAQDELLKSYIREKNRDGAELIDPLNKESKLYPSQIMVARDPKFGLGLMKDLSIEGARDRRGELFQKMKSKYPDVKPNERVLPKKCEEQRMIELRDQQRRDDDELREEEPMDNEN